MALTFGEFKDGDIKIRRAIFRKLIKLLSQNSNQLLLKIEGKTFMETLIKKFNEKNDKWLA